MGRVMVCAAVLAAGLLGGCATQATDAIPVASAMPEINAPAVAPAGFIGFCIRFATQCTAAQNVASTVTLTSSNWQSLTRINRDVNNAIWPEDDQKHYGRAEYWTIPADGYGDCDDYAVTKRKNLIDAGFPVSALRLAVVYSPRSGRHAVLTVATDKGDLVLDNLRDDILPWNTTGFVWLERQQASDPMKWVSFQPLMVAQNAEPAPNTASTGSGAIPAGTRISLLAP